MHFDEMVVVTFLGVVFSLAADYGAFEGAIGGGGAVLCS